MTKKDYFLLADAIREALARYQGSDQSSSLIRAGIMGAAHDIARILKSDNARFLPDRFFQYIEKGHMKGWGRGAGRGGR